MLSLAPFLYRNVFAEDGGPIQRVQSGTLPILGTAAFQSNAYLRPELVTGKSGHAVYGNADGTGSATSPAVAEHKAISEALERWAFLDTHKKGGRRLAEFGFDHDRSSNGMAAFPGFKSSAKRSAMYEAIERWAVIGWWDGYLDAEVTSAPIYKNVGMVRIKHGQRGEVVVLFHKSASGFVSYGHAAAENITTAVTKAAVELARTEFVLACYRAKGSLASIDNYLERRAVFFSSEEGFKMFQERLDRKPNKPAPLWRTIFDGEITGPWSKWATVWRHCVEMPTHAFLERDANFFFW